MDARILGCGRPQMASWRRNHDTTGPARQAKLYVEDAASRKVCGSATFKDQEEWVTARIVQGGL